MGNANSSGREDHPPGGAGGVASRPGEFVAGARAGVAASFPPSTRQGGQSHDRPVIGQCYACQARGLATVEPSSGDLRCGRCGAVGFVERLPARDETDGAAASSVSAGRSSSARDESADPIENAFGVPLGDLVAQLMGGLARLQSDDSGTFFDDEGGARALSADDQSASLCPRVIFGSEQQRQQHEEARRMMNAVFGSPGVRTAFGSGGGGANAAGGGQAPFLQQISNVVMQALNQALSGAGGAAGLAVGEDAMDQILTMIMQNDVNRYGSPPAAEAVIRSLQEETVSEEEAREAGPCAICQEEYRRDDVVHRLTEDRSQCSHIFHRQCIIPWLQQHNSCPVCRFELPTDDAAYNQRRAELRNRVRSTLSSVAAAATNPSASSPQTATGVVSASPPPAAGNASETAAREATGSVSSIPSAASSSSSSTSSSSSSLSSSGASSSSSTRQGEGSVRPATAAEGGGGDHPAGVLAPEGAEQPSTAASSCSSSASFASVSSDSRSGVSAGAAEASSAPSFSFRFSGAAAPAAGSTGDAGACCAVLRGPGRRVVGVGRLPPPPGVPAFGATLSFNDPEAVQQQLQDVMQQVFSGLANAQAAAPQRPQGEPRHHGRRGGNDGDDGCRQQSGEFGQQRLCHLNVFYDSQVLGSLRGGVELNAAALKPRRQGARVSPPTPLSSPRLAAFHFAVGSAGPLDLAWG
ncbi:zinc finger, C3HC4 type (RING finger) domain-containing protein [Besnoitia besnoiti]|uniref:RING-type E3 ubiquitin transferase n=1 Tax=Besnoitia besnoiti TaxID=94643 RepID=A0A2A9MC63_BESBE|nr:zinc finger, C3HC4 type (RING finger) domain-containing protein [Besnoitia besnoiti]PFH34814.1 zinc finger, C3HC4 type (RING finger) domain-containing protein [Besnoitia besnoiti]